MGRDNKDRYGWRHREDDAHGFGESAPGTTGDSEGTFHDRASADNNVIIDGEAQNYETHKRKQQAEGQSATEGSQQDSKTEAKRERHSLNGEVVEVEVDRVSNSGNPIAIYQGSHVHVPDGEPGETYEVELTRKSSYFVGTIRVKE